MKCDATLPHCLMCLKFGRTCPGPGNGPIIIDMTAKTKSKPSTKMGNKDPGALVVYDVPPTMPWTLQISHRNPLNEVFYSTFLSYFTATGEAEDIQNRQTWLHRLPTYSTDGTNTALEIAVQATASAFSGVKTRNLSLLQNACSLYGRALHMHSRLLRLKKEITVHMVSTSVLLSIFEAMHTTTASAYSEHLNGAAKMIEVAGPEQCMQGVLCQIYFHIRTQLVFVYLTSKDSMKKEESAERVLRGSLDYQRLPIMQRLLTLISRLSEIHVRFEDEENVDLAQQFADSDGFEEVRSAINILENEYKVVADKKGHRLTWKTPTGSTTYRNPYTALCIAYFATARLLLSVLAPHLPVVHVDPTDYSDIILEATAFLSTVKIGCAFMRMSAPLYLVAVHGQKVEQRMKALAVFEGWKISGLGGISALALERIHERGAKGASAVLGRPGTRLSTAGV
jgi:hypothetical protein